MICEFFYISQKKLRGNGVWGGKFVPSLICTVKSKKKPLKT